MTRREVLRLDLNGHPQEWITKNKAATYYATDSVAWTVGEVFSTLHGGMNSVTCGMSTIDIHPIIAVNGQPKVNLFDFTPSLTNRKLFVRDRMTCCYCGKIGREESLTRPTCQAGQTDFKTCTTPSTPFWTSAIVQRKTPLIRPRIC